MKVQVNYEAPMSAIVDTEAGTVDRVIVWCEGIKERDSLHAAVNADTQLPASLEQRVRAHEIVDSVTWPAWDLE